jgi:hypothetical protein
VVGRDRRRQQGGEDRGAGGVGEIRQREVFVQAGCARVGSAPAVPWFDFRNTADGYRRENRRLVSLRKIWGGRSNRSRRSTRNKAANSYTVEIAI